jgi:formate-dependent nitrite reductase membrane component NrfD
LWITEEAQIMKSYEWMVEYTPQRDWIEGQGIFIWLAEVFGMLGGGLYLISLSVESTAGMIIGWLMVVGVKGCFHLLHLGQPSRFWRLFLRPGSSWLSRGLIFVGLFALFGALHLTSALWLSGTGWETLFKILAAVLALLVAAYSGFVMNYVNGIPFWNSALLPLLFAAFGILGGLAVIMLIGLWGSVELTRVLRFAPLFLLASASLTALYLWSATYMGPAARRSVKELLRGRLAIPLWLGVGLCGAAFPAGSTLFMVLANAPSGPLLLITALAMLTGLFSFNYCLLKGGMYRPLTPVGS